MRLVRFEDESGGFSVDFHPRITVISGLPAHIRERLTRALAAIPSGGDPCGRGTIEVHGVRLELSRDTLELLELNEPIDVVIGPDDLPGSTHRSSALPSSDDRPDVATEVGSARAALDRLEQEYAEALAAAESYRTKIAGLGTEYEQLEREQAAAHAQVDPDAHRDLDTARANLRSVHDAAEARRDADADTRGTGSTAEDRAAELAELERRLSEAIETSNDLRRQLRSLQALDPEPVRVAVDALAPLVGGHRIVTSSDAGDERRERLVEAIDAVVGRWQRHLEVAAPEFSPRGVDPVALERLREEHDRAQRLVREIREELDRTGPDPELVAELEQIHDRIFEMDGKAPRFGAAKYHRTLEVLRSQESELLRRLGFDTWSSYVMGMSSVEARTEDDYEAAARTFETLDLRLAEAVRAHEENRSAVAAMARHSEERTELLSRSVELLDADDPADDAGDDPADPHVGGTGTGAPNSAATDRSAMSGAVISDARIAEVVNALLARRARLAAPRAERPVPPTSSTVDPQALATAEENLRWALGHTGVQLPDQELNAAQLCALAGGWLDAMSGLPDRIAEVSGERDELERVIEELGARYETLVADGREGEGAAAGGAEDSATGSRDETVAEAAVATAQQRCDAHDRAVETLAAVEAKRSRLEQRAADLRFSLDEREHRVAQLIERCNAAESHLRELEAAASEAARLIPTSNDVPATSEDSDIESLEWYVLARLAQQRAVSFVGSVPVVFDHAFAAWDSTELGDVLERLVRMGEVLQIIVLTDDPSVVEWARSVGESNAKVIDSFVTAR